MPEKWTKRSRPPSSGVMKPKPLSSLNHLTVPVAMHFPSLLLGAVGPPRGASINAGTVSPPQLLCRGGDLVRITGFWRPGQPQRVIVVARDHVHVEVKDGLPGGRAAGVQQVQPSRLQPLLHAPG